jgi:hypothetical protein
MTTDERNPLADFFLLLGEAHHAAKAVDDFDLRSEISESKAEFDRLCAEQAAACIALVQYCNSNKAGLEKMLSEDLAGR